MAIYDYDIKEIKKRLKQLRLNSDGSKKYTQVDVAKGIGINPNSSRTTITIWENLKSNTIPNLNNMIDLCNFFECDINYILGKKDIKSEVTNTISEKTHLSEESIEQLRMNPKFGAITDKILKTNLFKEIVDQIEHFSYFAVLNDVVTTSFTESFAIKIQKHFNDFIYSTFPMDINKKNFKDYLTKKIILDSKSMIDDFIKSNFLEDGQNYLYNLIDQKAMSDIEIYYDITLTSIVDICFDYLLNKQIVELSKLKLSNMFIQMIEHIVDQEAKEIKSNIKKTVHQRKLEP